MNRSEEVRDRVAESYKKAVQDSPGKSSSCGCGDPEAKGIAASLAGYSKEELNSIPRDAAVNSFGCGNPVAFGEISEGEVVLDLGSGAGIDLLLAAQKVGASGRVIGIDMTDAMIEKAEANIREAGVTNIEVRKGIIEDLPVESSSVDWVISNCVINLSPEKSKVFAEIARVLKPCGRMVVSDIVLDSPPQWVLDVQGLYESCLSGAISEKDYAAGLREAGLDDVDVRGRLDYDGASLTDLFGSATTGESCCGTSISQDISKYDLTELEGKVATVRFFARKPA